MSIAAALSGSSMMFLRREGARLQSNRVASTDTVVRTTNDEDPAENEVGAFINAETTNATAGSSDQPNIVDVEAGAAASDEPVEEEEEGTTESDEEDAEGISRYTVRHTMSLTELEEERELARRRSSACVLFALFVLFRLWILALQNGDFGLLMLCLVGSSWTARWIRHTRDQEEELDRRIANYLQNTENGNATNEVGRDDLRMLSFQAQLALAIMESQRQMMQGGGGYGNPDGHGTPGVSDEARGKWSKFTYEAARDKKESRRGSYGSVALQEVAKQPAGCEHEEPHCSICLGEYEEGEELSMLPCSHIYHHDCIGSWCSNHIRCPLCNYDLEAGAADAV